jgi:hypothetical protein
MVAITMPATKITKPTTIRINIILEKFIASFDFSAEIIEIETGIVFLELKSMPELSLELLRRVFAAS